MNIFFVLIVSSVHSSAVPAVASFVNFVEEKLGTREMFETELNYHVRRDRFIQYRVNVYKQRILNRLDLVLTDPAKTEEVLIKYLKNLRERFGAARTIAACIPAYRKALDFLESNELAV